MSHHKAVYAGSFDPITLGHLDVLRRSRQLFDEVVLGVGRNPAKEPLFSLEERVQMARTLVGELVAAEPRGAVCGVQGYTGLTVDFAREMGAVAMIRGIRNVTDLAGECQMAITNRQVAGIETVFIVAGETFGYTSSSLIRQIAAMGGTRQALGLFVPPLVMEAIERKRSDPQNALHRLAHEGDGE
ncbi:MAG: pantetheine-phosphate adenylyltransferase [Phycisphaerales bacterium]